MGKKGRKTRWRRLPIGGPESSGATSLTALSSPPAEEEEEGGAGFSVKSTSSRDDNHRVTFNEDEYTKITTPRQDVLFKKGYLGRRRTNNSSSNDAQELHSSDSVESEYIPEEPAQFTYVPPTGFIDHTGVLYVNSGTYELYDPYSGNVTVVVGPAPQYPPQPVLAAMPCQPVPLNPVEWFNPPAPWLCSYNNRRKRYSTDSQNCSAQSSESTGPPGSPQEPLDDMNGSASASASGVAMFPLQGQPGYIYPGYMFGAPVYNSNGVNVQGVVPQQQAASQIMTSIDQTNTNGHQISATTTATNTKRRKKRRRRRKGGITDEGSESSCEDMIGCDAGVCSQSGASSDAGQGSSCSKTNSDSGINTEPTPDSGSNTPPLMPQLSTSSAQSFQGSIVEEIHQDCLSQQNLEQAQIPELEAECEPISSSISTPEAHKCTFESLPSDDNETLQELSCSSDLNGESKLNCLSSELNLCCNGEQQTVDFVKRNPCLATDLNEPSNNPSCSLQNNDNKITIQDIETDTISTEICENFNFEQIIGNIDVDSCNKFNEPTSCSVHLNDSSANDFTFSEGNDQSLDKNDLSFWSLSIDSDLITVDEINFKDDEDKAKEEKLSDETIESCEVLSERSKEDLVVVEKKKSDKQLDGSLLNNVPCDYEIKRNSDSDNVDGSISNDTQNNFILISPSVSIENCCVKSKLETMVVKAFPETDCLSSCNNRLAPVPPPRRRRSLYRAAEKVAKKVVDEAIENGLKEASCTKCQHSLPITEAVTRWLQSQGSVIRSPLDDNAEIFEEEDEGIEDGDGGSLRNQKNVEGNPFLAPYLNGSGQRVADADECGSFISSAGEWDMYDHETYTRAMCNPATSVDKYYRLGAEDVGDKVASSASHSMIKTAVHIRRAGPFPCGVCCIIQ